MAAEALFGTWVPRAVCSGQPDLVLRIWIWSTCSGFEPWLTLASKWPRNPHLDQGELRSNPLNAGRQIQLRPLLSLHSSLQTIPGFCVLLHPTGFFDYLIILIIITLIILASIISTLAESASPFPAGSRKLE